MGATSADPHRLLKFLRTASLGRENLGVKEQDVRRTYQAFLESGNSVAVGGAGALVAVRPLIDDMAENERFIEVVREALMTADRSYRTGTLTALDGRIARRLERAGLSGETELTPLFVGKLSLLGVMETSGFVDDPVCTANGNFVHVETDLTFPARSGTLNFIRTYNALAAKRTSAFGPGWASILDMSLRIEDGYVRALLLDGAEVTFIFDDSQGTYISSERPKLRLQQHNDGWMLSDQPGCYWLFDIDGFLESRVVGRSTVLYERKDGRIVRCIEQASGRSLDISWTGDLVSRLIASDGREVEFIYENGHLVKVEHPAGGFQYAIVDHRIARIVDADEKLIVANVYDDYGRVLRQQSPFGRHSLYSYGATGVTVVTDVDGTARNAFVHDRNGNLTAMIDAKGYALRLRYDRNGNISGWTDRRGGEWNLLWDNEARKPIARTGPLGWEERWSWDDRSRLLAYSSPSGVLQLEYNGDSWSPQKVVEADGITTAIEVNEDDLPAVVTDADGITASLQWNADGQLVASTDGLGNCTRLAYDSAGQLTELRMPSGRVISYSRDTAGRVVSAVLPQVEWQYAWSKAGRAISGFDPLEGYWSAVFGEHGGIEQISTAESGGVTFDYDKFGNVDEVTGADGRSYHQTFDGLSQVVTTSDPGGAQWSYEYDPEGTLVTVSAPNGADRRRTTDVLGRAIEETDALGRRWTRRWNTAGQLVSITDPDGVSIEYSYDVMGRVIGIYDTTGYWITLVYTSAGRLKRRVDSTGFDMSLTYDQAGRLSSVADKEGRIFLDYDPDGFAVSACNDVGKSCGIVCDSNNRVVALTDHQSRIVRLDGVGEQIELPLHHPPGDSCKSNDQQRDRARFQWNRQGQLIAASDALGATSRFDHDPAGRLVQVTDPMGGVTKFGHDAAGRVATITDPAGNAQAVLRDRAGEAIGMRFEDGTGSRQWNDESGVCIGYSQCDAEGPTSTVQLDKTGFRVGRLAAGELRRQPGLSTVIDATFDRDGRVVGTPDGAVFTRDEAGQLVEWLLADGTSVQYHYDAGGRLVCEQDSSGETHYRYDERGCLREKKDADGVVTVYEYDLSGRRIAELLSDGSSVRYSWGHAGDLNQVIRSDAFGVAKITDITYDNVGLPIEIAGVTIAWDQRSGWPVISGIGDRRYRWVDGHLIEQLTDGSTRQMPVDWMGNVESDLDPWGKTRSIGDSSGVRIGYRSELCFDGLVWLKARVYDPATRVFLSPDPLPNPPGMPCAANPYHYGWNDPVTFVDPTGLRPLTQHDFASRISQEELGLFGKSVRAASDASWDDALLGLTVVAGVGLMFVPGGQMVGAGILIGTGMSGAIGVATHTFDPTTVALDGLLGGASSGIGVAVATAAVRAAAARNGLSMATQVLTKASTGAVSSAGTSAAGQAFTNNGKVSGYQVALDAGLGGFGGGGAAVRVPTKLAPTSIRFSQKSVNYAAEIIEKMQNGGWRGSPIDVLRMSDGKLTSLDNTRLLASRYAGIKAKANIRDLDEEISLDDYERFQNWRGGAPDTWGEAITDRIASQSKTYRNAHPFGSPTTGWKGN